MGDNSIANNQYTFLRGFGSCCQVDMSLAADCLTRAAEPVISTILVDQSYLPNETSSFMLFAS